jgi:hypothetical protein
MQVALAELLAKLHVLRKRWVRGRPVALVGWLVGRLVGCHSPAHSCRPGCPLLSGHWRSCASGVWGRPAILDGGWLVGWLAFLLGALSYWLSTSCPDIADPAQAGRGVKFPANVGGMLGVECGWLDGLLAHRLVCWRVWPVCWSLACLACVSLDAGGRWAQGPVGRRSCRSAVLRTELLGRAAARTGGARCGAGGAPNGWRPPRPRRTRAPAQHHRHAECEGPDISSNTMETKGR